MPKQLAEMHAEFVGDEPPTSPCAPHAGSCSNAARKRSQSDTLISPARGSPASSTFDEAQEAALMAERQAQVQLLNPFQRLTVDIPHDRKRLRLCQSDDPLEVESLGEIPPSNPDSADEPSSFVADFDMEPCRRSPTDHERLSPISRVLLTGKPGKAPGLWTLQRRGSFATRGSSTPERSSLTPDAALPRLQSTSAGGAGSVAASRMSTLPPSRALHLESVEPG